MDQPTIQAELSSLASLLKFAKDSRLPYRTLWRIKNGGEHKATTTNLRAIEAALKRLKPAKKDQKP